MSEQYVGDTSQNNESHPGFKIQSMSTDNCSNNRKTVSGYFHKGRKNFYSEIPNMYNSK